MARRTPLLITPTIDEVKRVAKDIQLPDREAVRFFNFYESKGWMVGKNRMVSFRGALENWKMGWEDRGGNRGSGSGQAESTVTSGMDKMILHKEFERVEARMHSIKAGYGEAQTWTTKDRELYGKLLERRKELRMKLGVML